METETTNGSDSNLPRKKEYANTATLTPDTKSSNVNIILKNVKCLVVSIIIVTFAETIKIVKIWK